MLLLDAVNGIAPNLWVVLTARQHLTRQDCRRHLAQLLLAARRRWPDVQWFVQVEFQRRGALHLNLLVKGVPTDDREQLHELLSRVWCARVDALPVGQWSGTIEDAGGVVRYLAKTLGHGLKSEQAPPIGWRGHRTSQTRGYLYLPAGELRPMAAESIRHRRAIAAAERAGHAAGHDAEVAAAEQLAYLASLTWSIYRQPLPTPAPAVKGEWFGGLPRFVLEGAFRWQDERDLIDECLDLGRLGELADSGGGAPEGLRSSSAVFDGYPLGPEGVRDGP